MNRRRYLASVLASVGVAGCLQFGGDETPSGGTPAGSSDGGDGAADADGGSGTPTGTPTDTAATTATAGDGTTTAADPTATATPTPEPTASPTQTHTPIRRGNVELPLPEEKLNRGAPKDAIPAITGPTFASNWTDADLEGRNANLQLRADDTVIAVERQGEARAYPLRVLNWHEICNDEFHGPLLVTYCPLCGSGMTAVRKAGGEETVFGVSGLLWRSDLVMYDQATESLWSQIMATAIRGKLTGETLELVPSSMTSWEEFKADYPEGQVLLPAPSSNTIRGEVNRDYSRNPYESYDESDSIGIGYNEFEDDRLHPKAVVIGVTHDGTAKAYPLDAIQKEGVVNDAVNGLPVVVATGTQSTLYAYERTVDGETLEFTPASDSDAHMTGGGSRWKISTGEAVDGPHEGTTLTRANDKTQLFWFAWLDFHEDTKLYGNEE